MDSRVVDLDVSENNIGPLGTMYLSEMLTRNNYIVELVGTLRVPRSSNYTVTSENPLLQELDQYRAYLISSA